MDSKQIQQGQQIQRQENVPNFSPADVVVLVRVVVVVIVEVVAISAAHILRSISNSAESVSADSEFAASRSKRTILTDVRWGLSDIPLPTPTPAPTTPAAASSHAHSTILAGCRPRQGASPQRPAPASQGAPPIRSASANCGALLHGLGGCADPVLDSD